MPGSVPGTDAVRRPDRSRRGAQPSGALCGPVRRGWPGQARPGRRRHEGDEPHALPRHARACPGHPRRTGPDRSRRGPQPSGAPCGPVRRGWPGQARPGRRDHEGDEPLAPPASCPGLSRAPTPCRSRTGPGEGRRRPVRPAARSGVGGRDKPGQDGGAMRETNLTPSRVMPGPVPGTHAVPRPDRVRRGPQPSSAPCGTGRRGWPGQARPGRRGDGRGRASRSPPSCPGLSRAPTPCRGRTGPGEGRSRPVRPAARSGVGGRDKPGQDGGAMDVDEPPRRAAVQSGIGGMPPERPPDRTTIARRVQSYAARLRLRFAAFSRTRPSWMSRAMRRSSRVSTATSSGFRRGRSSRSSASTSCFTSSSRSPDM